MKMLRKLAVNLIFASSLSLGLCFITALAIAQSRAPQSDLEKNQAIIHDAIEQSGFYQTSGPNGEFLSERNHIVFDGCKATIHVLTVGADQPPYKRESYNFDFVFNLKEMDPKVVASPQDLNGNKLPDNREWVILRTADRGETTDRNESMSIWNGKTQVSVSSAYPVPSGANHEENQKLADAFTRAIALCKAGSRP
jgi:hypothetical protein